MTKFAVAIVGFALSLGLTVVLFVLWWPHFDLLEETDAGNWDILFLLASLSLIVALAFGCLLVVLLVSSWLRHFKSAYDDLRETSSADR